VETWVCSAKHGESAQVNDAGARDGPSTTTGAMVPVCNDLSDGRALEQLIRHSMGRITTTATVTLSTPGLGQPDPGSGHHL
jgi:hypothetical protein